MGAPLAGIMDIIIRFWEVFCKFMAACFLLRRICECTPEEIFCQSQYIFGMVLSLLLSATPANADITPWIAASLHDPAKWDTAGLYTATPWLLPSVDSRR